MPPIDPISISDVLINGIRDVNYFLRFKSCPYMPGTDARKAIDDLVRSMVEVRHMLDELPLPSSQPYVETLEEPPCPTIGYHPKGREFRMRGNSLGGSTVHILPAAFRGLVRYNGS